MRSLRFLSAAGFRHALLMVLPGALIALGAVHCGGGSEETPQPEAETGAEVDVDSTADAPPMDAPDETTADTAPPDAGPPVTCTKGPSYSTPLRVNHNPDSLRRVANAGMVQLDDGRLMIVMLEAIDTGTRYAVWARTVDPATSTISPDERLDTDADGITDASPLQVSSVSGGAAVAVRYGGAHARVYSKGKWSPDLASALTIAATDDLGAVAAPTGQVLVTRGRAGSAPNGNAIAFRPDEGGAKGSWSVAQALDLAGSSGKPRIDAHALPDGRFITLTWQGPGGPAVRTRSLSGSWSTPSNKAEVGAADANPQYRILDDGSIVLAGLEGSGDTRRVVTSTWTSADNWSTARLLSKLPGDTNGVVPAGVGPYLFTVSGAEAEFVAWVAGCAAVAADCEFQAVSRRYSGGVWKEPQALGVGEKRNGADGASVVALDDATPLVARLNFARNNVDLRVRSGADYTPAMPLTADSPLFGPTTFIEARFYGDATNLWTLVRRETTSMGITTPMAMVMGRVNATAGKVSWSPMLAGSYEVRTFSAVYPYVDGSGGFSVGAGIATTGTENAPILAHANLPSSDLMAEASSVISTDENSATFVNVPRTAPRPGRDRSALYLLAAKPSAATTRLRAYAYNGVGGAAPRVLANESRAPRAFADGTVLFGCGGAILYASDPIDGSHTLELVLVRESAAMADAG